MEIELTDKQMEKVEILKSQDISVGEAIDLLFEVKDEISNQDKERNLIEKINETGFDLENKAENVKKNFTESETYEISLKSIKHEVKWSNFFKTK